MSHYDTLGVARDADEAAIKAAFRRHASAAHPDRGGEHDDMAKVNRAYEVLANPERRAQYDQTGSDVRQRPIEAEAKDALMMLFAAALDDPNEHVTMLQRTRHVLEQNRAQQDGQRGQVKAALQRIERRMSKVRRKGDGDDLMLLVARQKLAQTQANLAQLERNLAVFDTVLRMLDEYESDETAQAVAAYFSYVAV